MVNKARRKKETQLLGIHDQHIGQMMSSIKVDTAICHLFPHPSNLMCMCMFGGVGVCTGYPEAVLGVKRRIYIYKMSNSIFRCQYVLNPHCK